MCAQARACALQILVSQSDLLVTAFGGGISIVSCDVKIIIVVMWGLLLLLLI